MKKLHRKLLRRVRVDGIPVAIDESDRRGSVLLVVIGLLGMLLLVGIMFYSFATQEQASSQYYAEAAKKSDEDLVERLWDYSLEQLILGTNDTDKQHSALWGRRHALLTGVLGRTGTANFDGFDLTPFNGMGINLHYSTTPGFIGDPYFDQNFDGVDDYAQMPAPTTNYLNFNYSPAANGGTAPVVPTFPAPDVDYTSADINTLALSYVGRGLDTFGADVNVIIPSFHRPQLLRQNGIPIPNWPTNPVTAQRVLRPHPNHTCVGSALPRFLSAAGLNGLGQTVNPFPFGSTVTLQQGVWDASTALVPPVAAQPYQWDVDNDGDGVKEGIWMDLDFPIQTWPDGRKYVPLFSYTVTDADSLINLNVSGNQAGLNNLGLPLAGGRHVSRSNQGLSRAEISPEWAMLANPMTDPAPTTQQSLFWNTAAGTISRLEMANIDALFLNLGRPDFSVVNSGSYSVPGAAGTTYEPLKYYSGRYGESQLMSPNGLSANGIAGYGKGSPANRDFTYLPQPGKSNVLFPQTMSNPFGGDDDYDNQLGHSHYDNAGYYFAGASFTRSQSNVAYPSYVHPLDFFGEGTNLLVNATGLRTQLSNSGLTTPMQWPFYSYGYSAPTDTIGAGCFNYLNAGAGGALLPSTHSAQIDEADEIIAEWKVATSNGTMLQDDVFGADTMFEMHATNADLANVSASSRMRNLASYNFQDAAQSEQIRRQFTTLSHDRKNFGLSPYYRRGWEFNADSDADGNYEFPPSFIAPYTGVSAIEPFRQVLRQLLHVEVNQSTAITSLAQLRLNLNRLLSGFDTTTGPIGAPIYRELTAHPTTALPNTPITTPTWNADSPTGTPSPNDQEWWARYDRQRMARDIYVLLYTLGGGMDATSYVTTSNMPVGSLYSNAQLKEMAQFAVNVVDELDRDDVITKFEYDKNLMDGWNLNDNPYNSLTDPENALTDRAVVYGVEAQKLTLSELLLLISRRVETTPGSGTYTNHVATQVDDTGASDRYYTYMELRNASPFNVDLSTGAWQIAVQDDPDGIPNTGDETDRVQLTLISGSTVSYVSPGATFTIGTRGGPVATDPLVPANNLPSIFKVDTTGAATPDFTMSTTWIAPASGTLDLDLIPTIAGSPNNTAQFRLTDGSASSPLAGTDYTTPGAGLDVTTAGNFLYGGAGGNVSAAQEILPHIFVLRRRANMTRTMPVSYSSSAASHTDQSLDNPWIEVDRLQMPTWRDFALLATDTMTEVQTKLAPLTSYERAQPFSRNLAEAAHAPVAAAPYRSNSVAAVNSNSPASFTQVQLHFDRDFASSADLLSVPLYGPDQVTRRVGQPARFNDDNPTTLPTALLAQERFLRPQAYANLSAGVPAGTIPSPATMATDILNNRWYRLLELVEVPTQTERGLTTYPYALRSSGAINLNGARHRGVLAGLVDDPDNPTTGPIEGHHNPAYAAEAAMLYDQYEGRDWWYQFLLSRDGVDPITGLILPGTPQGHPFRSLGYVERSSLSLEETVLRSLPLDVVNAGTAYPQFTGGAPAFLTDRRSLFEARMSTDRPSSGGGDVVDVSTRNRLLRKVVNNSTTRSNVFVVWITTRFFEAIEQPTGEVQIGDVLQGAPDHRGFFVIDRSLPEQAYNSNLGKFDYRKFVQYRKTIQ